MSENLHLAMIMDGNRRWAKERNLPTLEGHFQGYEKVKDVAKWCKKRGVKMLTLWAFSTENWHRSKVEVAYLMKLLVNALNDKNIKEFNEKGVKIRIIGQKERLPKSLQERIKIAEESTKNNKKSILNLAISYGGRPEIVQAIKKMIDRKTPSNKITEDLINRNLWTAGLPDPDFIIRTGGEHRLSNFLTWQSAYSEFYFPKKFWPEFTQKDMDKAFKEFAKRNRRFGK